MPGVSTHNRYASVGKGGKTRGGGAVPWNAKAEVSTGLYPGYQGGTLRGSLCCPTPSCEP